MKINIEKTILFNRNLTCPNIEKISLCKKISCEECLKEELKKKMKNFVEKYGEDFDIWINGIKQEISQNSWECS